MRNLNENNGYLVLTEFKIYGYFYFIFYYAAVVAHRHCVYLQSDGYEFDSLLVINYLFAFLLLKIQGKSYVYVSGNEAAIN